MGKEKESTRFVTKWSQLQKVSGAGLELGATATPVMEK